MKLKDIEHIPEQDVREMLVEIVSSFENDAKHFENKVYKEQHDKILYNIFNTRLERVNFKLDKFK
jgi:hypothetical protein